MNEFEIRLDESGDFNDNNIYKAPLLGGVILKGQSSKKEYSREILGTNKPILAAELYEKE